MRSINLSVNQSIEIRKRGKKSVEIQSVPRRIPVRGDPASDVAVL